MDSRLVPEVRPPDGPCDRGIREPGASAHSGGGGRSSHAGRAGSIRSVDTRPKKSNKMHWASHQVASPYTYEYI